MNVKNFLKEEIQRQVKAINENSVYIGSCVDVGKGGKPVCNYFSDATELSNIVDNERKYEQISREKFFEYVDKKDVPDGALDGEVFFYFVTYSPIPGESLSIDEAGLFYLYNLDKDIHYFFEVE